jgi:hypothetical protein
MIPHKIICLEFVTRKEERQEGRKKGRWKKGRKKGETDDSYSLTIS